jgi:hypothetical protein
LIQTCSCASADIGLAEELERAVAGASVEARLHALKKLRARVKEQAEPDAPDWLLSQSTQVRNPPRSTMCFAI